jgi:hypothetical protein
MAAIVLLRCHTYDEHVKVSYAALARCCERDPPWLLLDTSRGDIATDVPTLRFSGERLRRLGLALYPEDKWAWFAGDYALYCAFLERPEFSHYVMIDYDAKVNFPVDRFLERIAASNQDLIAPYAGFERADWMWSPAGKYWFDRVAGCFFPIVVLSRRLILRCLEHRLAQTQQVPVAVEARRTFLQRNWMNCEAFVPSVALHEGYAMADIEKFVSGWTYAFIHDIDALPWDLPALAEVPCAHPVFLRQDLPDYVHRRLQSLPSGPLRSWLLDRVAALQTGAPETWRAIRAVSPEIAGVPPA